MGSSHQLSVSVYFVENSREVPCQEGPLEGHMDRVTIEEFLRTLRNSLELGVTNMLEALND